jgi:hypothetical protein
MGKESKRGKNPKSLANLKPIAKGEIRNPEGHNGSTLINAIYDRIMAESGVQSDLANTLRRMVKDPRYALQVAKEVREARPQEKMDHKEAHVYLVVGEEKTLDNAKTVTGSVEITGGDDGRIDNEPGATSARAKPR